MRDGDSSWKRLALAIGGLVLLLGVVAWLDKPECVEIAGQQASRCLLYTSDAADE